MKIVKLIILLLVFGFGILFGFSFRNFAYIEWNREIKIYEVFQVVSTLFIAIVVPFFIKKWIDDGRMIKSLINEESREIHSEIKSINNFFIKCYENKSIAKSDKEYILLLFNLLENQIDILQQSLRNSFGDKHESEFHDFRIAYFEYEKIITGGELMNQEFTVLSFEFFELQAQEYRNLLAALRKFNIEIQKK